MFSALISTFFLFFFQPLLPYAVLENIAFVPPTSKNLCPVNLNIKTVSKTADLKLRRFVTKQSQNLFSKLKINKPRTLEDLETTPLSEP